MYTKPEVLTAAWTTTAGRRTWWIEERGFFCLFVLTFSLKGACFSRVGLSDLWKFSNPYDSVIWVILWGARAWTGQFPSSSEYSMILLHIWHENDRKMSSHISVTFIVLIRELKKSISAREKVLASLGSSVLNECLEMICWRNDTERKIYKLLIYLKHPMQ